MKTVAPPLAQIWVTRLSQLAGGLVFLSGILSVLGWTFGISTFTRILPGLLPMVPNTAVCFILGGIALWLVHTDRLPEKVRKIAITAIALVIGLASALTLGEHLLGWQSGIDQLLFRQSVRGVGSATPGRTAFLAALNFFILSGAIILLGKRTRAANWTVDLLIVIPLLVSLLALIGYACNVPSFYGWRSLFPNTPMALHTAVAFVLLATGLLCARPDRGLMKVLTSGTAGGVVGRRLLLTPIVIPLLTGLIRITGRRAGLYNEEFANWFFALLNILAFTGAIWWIASLLHRTDTVRQRAENEVRQLNAELEGRVIERTRELAETTESLRLEMDERQRVEQIGREQQELLSAIADNSPAVIHVKDLAGRYVLVNRRFTELLHVEGDAVIGRTDSDLFSKETAEAFRKVDLRAASAGTAVVEEEIVPQDDGPHTYLSVKCPLHDDTGKAYAIFGISTDITERKRAEEKAAWLASFPERNPNPIVEVDLERRVLHYVNPFAGRLFPDLQSAGLQHPFLDGLEEAIRPAILDGSHIVRRELALGDFCYSQTLNYIPESQRVRVYGSDITERRRAEAGLRAQLGRLDLLSRITRAIGERQDLFSIFQVVIRSLEDDLPIDLGCFCLYDPNAQVLTVSCVGVRSEALSMELALPERSRLEVDQNGLRRCVQGQLVYEPDVAEVDSPFSRRLAAAGLRSLVVAPLFVESQVFGVLVAARRQPQAFSSGECEFLRQLSEQVALAVHQTELLNALQRAYDELRQTQQAVMQQDRLRALGEMASGIAHDINNAISPVSLFTEVLLEGEPNLTARARDYLETIQRAISDVAGTVSRMREFYRPREPQSGLVPLQLNQAVREVLDLTRARWSDMPQQRGVLIRTVTELADGLPEIAGVETEIREALVNLVFNAVDAMTNGGTLTLRTRVMDGAALPAGTSSPPRVCVEIADTGIGMDETTRSRCLEPFYTTKGERGTGLGLSMVYGIVQRHGGGVEIESALDQGTTMRLSFAAFVPATPASPDPESKPTLVMPSQLRILVVDDDPLLLKSLRDILEGDGHVVVSANHGRTGIDEFLAAQARAEPFRIVISDLGMPSVDGRQVASAIKEASPSTPIVLLTGWGQRLLDEGDIPPHVDRVLSKPPKLRELRETLAFFCQPRLAPAPETLHADEESQGAEQPG